MADRKLSQLPALTGANTASGDLLYIVDVSEPLPADQSKKITLTEFQSAPISAGTANGLLYLNASKVPTSGVGLTYDGTDLTVVGAVNAGSVNTTTLDLTNLEVTNIKAKDGTAAATIADATGKITVSTELAVDNLNLSGNTLASTDTNGNIVIAPNGTGDVQLDADTVRVGDANSNALITTNGTGDLVLNTNSGTNSGFITIEDGVNGNIIIAPNGTGQVQITNAALDLTTIEVTNIKAKDGTAAMTLADSTGVTTFAANPILDAGTANGVLYLNASKVATSGSALTFDGTNFFGGTNTYVTGRFYAQRSSSSLNLPIAGYTDGSLGAVLTGTKGDIVAFGNAGGDGVIFANANTEQMRLTSTGLGIGTSSPGYKLDVVGTVNVRATTSGAGQNALVLRVVDSANSNFANAQYYANSHFWGYAGSANGLTLDSAGNLGLGVTPSAWASGYKAFQIGNNATSVSALFSNNPNNFWSVSNAYFDGTSFKYITTSTATGYEQQNGQHIWYTAASGTAGNAISFTQAMTLDASGRLGIGETNPNFILDVAGDSEQQAEFTRTGTTTGASYARFANSGGSMYIGVDSSVGGRITNSTTPYAAAITTSNATPIIFGTNNTERARITSGGTFQTQLDAEIYGVTVGRGAGAVATNTAVGASALAANTSGSSTTAVGANALAAHTSGAFNVAVGANAGLNATSFANATVVGMNAIGTGIATGTYITAIGTSALQKLTSGSYITGVGVLALKENTTGSYNTALGVEALQANTTASNNTAVGYQAGYSNTTGTATTAIGFQALYAQTTPSTGRNTAVGYQSAISLTTGNQNTAIGTFAMNSFTTGDRNTALGEQALYGAAGATGTDNVAIGKSAASAVSTGSYNVAIGANAYINGTTGGYNVAIGADALQSNTTATDNTAVGWASLYSNTTGASNVALGNIALYSTTTGSYNTAIGHQALRFNTTASNNTAVGYQAGYSNTTGTQNTSFGAFAGYSRTTGGYNLMVGMNAGYYGTTGTGNTFVGQRNDGAGAGQEVTTGSKNTILGGYNGNQGGLDIRTSDNYIVLSDGDGNPRQVIDGSGNVGIGTSSPGARLQVSGSTAGGAVSARVTNTEATGMSTVEFTDGTNTRGQIWAGNGSYASFGGAGSLNYSANSGPHVWYTNYNTGGERMRLDASGNLGLGVTPSGWAIGKVFQFNNGCLFNNSVNNTYLGQNFYYDGSNNRYIVNGAAIQIGLEGGSGIAFRVAASGTAGNAITFTQAMTLDASGRLGIGITNPSVLLHIYGTTNGDQYWDAGGSVRGYAQANTSNAYFAFGTTTNHATVFLTNSTERARITSGGDFQTSSGNSVMVGGTAARATTAGTNRVDIFDGTAPVGTLANGVSFYSASGEANVMDAAGNATLLSPHDAVTNEWIFRSKHTPTGKVLKIDVERLLKFVNDHFGLDAVHEFIED